MFSGRSPSPCASGLLSSHPGHRTISYFLDQGCRGDVDEKELKVLYACGVPFNVLCSPYWHDMAQAVNGAPKGYKIHECDKVRTFGLDRERTKIHNALGNFSNDCNHYALSIVSNRWANVKGMPFINILGVSASGVVFLSSHDLSDIYKTNINISKSLLKTIQDNGPYNVIQVITDNATKL
jgi:hypothetical protein